MRTARLARIGRDEFVAERWDYRRGEHVSLSGATGFGKTQLIFELLARCATPELPAVVFQQKPKDETIERHAPLLRYPTIPDWPPPFWHRHVTRPAGYILRPPFSFVPEVDDVRQYQTFRRAMLHCYRKGNHIVVGDELYNLVELGLSKTMITMWSKARSMGTGFWGGVQKPSHVPLWCWNNCQHLFLTYEADFRNRKRFGEFGGIDPRLIEDTVANLGQWEMFYARRRGRVAAIITP